MKAADSTTSLVDVLSNLTAAVKRTELFDEIVLSEFGGDRHQKRR